MILMIFQDLPRFSSPTPQVSTSKCLANSAPEGEIRFAVVIRLHWLQCAAPLRATLDSPQRPQCVAQLWAQANACRMHRLNQTESDWILDVLDALQCHNVNLDLTEVCEQFARSVHLHVLSFIMKLWSLLSTKANQFLHGMRHSLRPAQVWPAKSRSSASKSSSRRKPMEINLPMWSLTEPFRFTEHSQNGSEATSCFWNLGP